MSARPYRVCTRVCDIFRAFALLRLRNGRPSSSSQILRSIGGGEPAEMMRPAPDQQPYLHPVAQAHSCQREHIRELHHLRSASLHQLEVECRSEPEAGQRPASGVGLHPRVRRDSGCIRRVRWVDVRDRACSLTLLASMIALS